jgi:hypothetical protein
LAVDFVLRGDMRVRTALRSCSSSPLDETDLPSLVMRLSPSLVF